MLSWRQLIHLDDPELSRMDIAVMNFACAEGLPAAVKQDADGSVRAIDEMAGKVRSATARLFHQFQARPAEYHNSADYFRALALVTVLQRDCGIQYNPAKIPEHARFAPEDSFLFGVVQTKLGTCANIPVLYVAVGRRLGYPLRLVGAKGANATHFFVRWDDPNGERFNIEATAEGMRCPSDDYYRTGRYDLAPDHERRGNFLKSMTPRQELAAFLAERFWAWYDERIYRHAIHAMGWACSLSPDNAFYLNRLKSAMNERWFSLKDRKPQRFPKIVIVGGKRRFPLSFPLELEKDVLGLEALENMLNNQEHDRRWWQPMRNRQPLFVAPAKAMVDFHADGCRISSTFGTLSKYSYDLAERN